jgi:hypothetical protein
VQNRIRSSMRINDICCRNCSTVEMSCQYSSQSGTELYESMAWFDKTGYRHPNGLRIFLYPTDARDASVPNSNASLLQYHAFVLTVKGSLLEVIFFRPKVPELPCPTKGVDIRESSSQVLHFRITCHSSGVILGNPLSE